MFVNGQWLFLRLRNYDPLAWLFFGKSKIVAFQDCSKFVGWICPYYHTKYLQNFISNSKSFYLFLFFCVFFINFSKFLFNKHLTRIMFLVNWNICYTYFQFLNFFFPFYVSFFYLELLFVAFFCYFWKDSAHFKYFYVLYWLFL